MAPPLSWPKKYRKDFRMRQTKIDDDKLFDHMKNPVWTLKNRMYDGKKNW